MELEATINRDRVKHGQVEVAPPSTSTVVAMAVAKQPTKMEAEWHESPECVAS